MYYDIICKEFEETIKIMKLFINNKNHVNTIQSAAKIIANAFKIGKKSYLAGTEDHSVMLCTLLKS